MECQIHETEIIAKSFTTNFGKTQKLHPNKVSLTKKLSSTLIRSQTLKPFTINRVNDNGPRTFRHTKRLEIVSDYLVYGNGF